MKIGKRPGAITRGLLLALALCFIYAGLAQHSGGRAAERAERSLEVGRRLESVVSAILNQESLVRAYIVTGEQTFLRDWEASRRTYETNLQALEKLEQDDPVELARLHGLAQVAARKQGFMQQTADARTRGGLEDAAGLVRGMQGKLLMDEIRTLVDEMTDDQARLFREHSSDAAWARLHTQLGIGILIGMLCWSFLQLRRQASALAEVAARSAKSDERYRLRFEHSKQLVRPPAPVTRSSETRPNVRPVSNRPVESTRPTAG